MDGSHPDRVTAFDTLFTTNHIQMLKLLVSYLGPSIQGQLAVYIKLLELQYTLRFVQNHPAASIPFASCPEPPGGGVTGLLDEMLPFCSPKEKEKLQNIKQMYQNMENMQEMMQMLEMLQEISPELFSGGGMPGSDGADSNASPGGAMNFLNMLSGLGGTDMSQLSDMLQELFNT